MYREKTHALAKMVGTYLWGNMGYEELKSQVPLGTNFLRGTEAAKARVRNKKVLLVAGWCPMKDEVLDLDTPLVARDSRCLTSRL